ncbi:MAG: hypothetical protein PVH03_06755, partial [Chloroflexota bacterium]
TADGTILTGLSVNLLYALFSPDNESLIVALDDGRAYLLDLDWLQSMDGRADELSIDELVKLACDGPLSRDLAQPNSIRTYLAENIGIDKPQACR